MMLLPLPLKKRRKRWEGVLMLHLSIDRYHLYENFSYHVWIDSTTEKKRVFWEIIASSCYRYWESHNCVLVSEKESAFMWQALKKFHLAWTSYLKVQAELWKLNVWFKYIAVLKIVQGPSSSEHLVAVERVTSSYFALAVFFIFLCLGRSVKFVSVSGGVCNGADPKSCSVRMRLWG